MTPSGRPAFVAPSLLAADIGALADAARALEEAGAEWVHVDVGDGSGIAGRQLTSLGPSSIAAVRAAAPSLRVDVHLYTMDPEAHVDTLAEAMGHDGRITYQYESLTRPYEVAVGQDADGRSSNGGAALTTEEVLARARALGEQIRAAGCTAGVCIAPYTPIELIEPLVAEGEVWSSPTRVVLEPSMNPSWRLL